MRRPRRFDSNHVARRSGLRALGAGLALVGVVLTGVGLVSFFSAFGGDGTPDQFWCAFVGLPMLAVGMRLLAWGYMGSIARYAAGEAAPVARDATRYLLRETRGAVRDAAAAVREGLTGGPPAVQACAGCGHDNDADARFCDQCGAALARAVVCRACAASNESDARFCRACGQPVQAS